MLNHADYVRDENGEPVVDITHAEAAARCRALGGRLPTLAEAAGFRITESAKFGNLNEWVIPQPIDGIEYNVRGGAWSSYARYVRVSCRHSYLPGYQLSNIGFRCIREEGQR